MKITDEEREAIKGIRKGAKASGISISKKEALERLRATRHQNDINAAKSGFKRTAAVDGVARFTRTDESADS